MKANHRMQPCLWFEGNAEEAVGYDRMMVALMGMKKLIIADLEKAFKG